MRDFMGKKEIEDERKERRPREVPLKICLQCYTLSPSAQRVCNACGHEFYAKKGKTK